MVPRPKKSGTKTVDDYRHDDSTRLNNPPVGLAHFDTAASPNRVFSFDPRIDPQLQWAGKGERPQFSVSAPSIHVHERLSAEAILRSVRKSDVYPSLFGDEDLDRSKVIEFYAHEMGWTNRMILGDSMIVMASLLERERLAGRVQVVYVDPPYGVNYNANFQPRLSQRAPKNGSDDSLTREPEQIQAYRDTWELEVHSYLTYIRDRLIAAHELLADTGSVFVQISVDNMHLVRQVLDEVFGADNFRSQIVFLKTSSAGSPGELRSLPTTSDLILWYAKDRDKMKYRQLYSPKEIGGEGAGQYTRIEEVGGHRRSMTAEERSGAAPIPSGARVFRADNLTSQSGVDKTRYTVDFEGREFRPGTAVWKTSEEGMGRLVNAHRLFLVGNTLSYVRYIDDFAAFPMTDVWSDTRLSGFAEPKRFVVQTNPKVIARCVLMASDPGDLVVDPTCGSGTTALVCEQYGRRWITVDTSRVALAIARERLLTSKFPYYALVDEGRNVDAGLRYETLPRITLRSIARNEPPDTIALYDRPLQDKSKIRVSGPFSVEALSRYAYNPSEEPAGAAGVPALEADALGHVTQLLDALQRQGIPHPGAKPLRIATLRPLAGTGPLQAEGMFLNDQDEERRFAVSLGPRFGAITPSQVDEALQEAYGYDLVVFAGFAAHAESQKMLAKGKRGRYEVALLLANPDLLLAGLLKNTAASQTFRLFASPDVELQDGGLDADGQREWRVEVLGVDAFDAATGEVRSSTRNEIRAWFVDPDYDGLVFHVRQAFFPHTGSWESLGKALKGTLDEELLEQMSGYRSLAFPAGPEARVAVRVITDDGNAAELVLQLGSS